jgi:periplasmic copper chaperone A
MMTRIATTCGALLAGIMLAGGAQAHSHKLKSLEIVHPWCWETEAATKTVAVYMTVRNRSRRPDRLVRATASIADKAELRGPGDDESVKSFDAKAGGELILRRDGPHILLTGVKRQLSPYDAFVMTLVFERAGKIEVEVAVEEASKEPAKH